MSSDKTPELEAYIAFRLNQMSERNEHHRFEEIATRIARKRISANILVANGPVSAGGDQQRDAESYTTRIPDELPHSAGFSASASTSPVVLACTVQRGGLKAKVLADLEGVCASNAAPVGLVTFFSVHSIPEAASHELQQVARERFGVTLNVLSGMKIATMLAEPDLVWVAQHYLEVPASMIPDPVGETIPEWYAALRDALRSSGGPDALTPAAQGEIAEGLRFAIWDDEANADLPEWLDFMGAFLQMDASEEMRFRASYEIAVARFRGMGIAGGSEDLIRDALAIAGASSHPHILDDAVTLATYWGNMWISGVGTATANEIAEARTTLLEHASAELLATDAAAYPVRTASLIGTLVMIHLQPQWDVAERNGLVPKRAEVAAHVGRKLDPAVIDPDFADEAGLFDLGGAMRYLSQLVDLLPRARAYSVSGIAEMFTMFAPALSSHPDYVRVRDALDYAVAAVHGDAAIAERSRDRGVAFLKAERPLDALLEFHEAKVRWFHGDLLFGAVLAIRFIGKIYRDLGLVLAAKMYASAAAALANQSPADDVKKHVPRALLEVARSAQVAGCWVDAAAFTEVAILAHTVFEADALNLEKHPELDDHAANEALEYAGVRAHWPNLASLIETAHADSTWFAHVVELADSGEYPIDEVEFQRRAREQLSGPVLSDIGRRRIVDFRALGVRWTFDYPNDRESVLAAEGIIAAFQVFLADAARFHPVVVSADLRIAVEIDRRLAPGAHVLDFESQDDLRARLRIGTGDQDADSNASAILTTCVELLGAVHARPTDELSQLLDDMARDGIFHKILVGRPYTETADLLTAEHYERCAAAVRPASSADFEPHAPAALAASTKRGPGYDEAESLQLIHERYSVAQGWKYTLATLLTDDRGRAALLALRGDGWLDWQMLVAIVNIGLNHRVAESGTDPRRLSPQQIREFATRPEQESDRRVSTDFVLEHLHANLFVQTATVAQRWKLRGPSERPGEGILRELLVRRYNFAVDDVPHQDLFTAVDKDGALLPLLP